MILKIANWSIFHSGHSVSNKGKETQTFRLTLHEMEEGFIEYVNEMERLGAHQAGLAKIIPPPEW